MSLSPLPAPFDQLGGHHFSFYPAIRNVDHNEWRFRRATWQEVVVVNTRSGEEFCIPRTFIGEASVIDDPVIIVGLRRELEWKDQAVIPYRRAVVEFPMAVNDTTGPVHAHGPAEVVSIRLEHPVESRRGRRIAVAVAIVLLIVANIVREIQLRRRAADAMRRLSTPAGALPVSVR